MDKNEEKILDEELDKILADDECEEVQSEEFESQQEQTNKENDSDKLKQLEEKLKEAEDKYLRLYADFENFRKRSLKEKTDALIYASSPIMEKLINVVDNFDRALTDSEDDSPLCEGMKMVQKQLNEILSSEGLKEIKTTGEQFDPNIHNAVMVENNADVPDEQIVNELQKGYVYKDKVIRPSMVTVNKHE